MLDGKTSDSQTLPQVLKDILVALFMENYAAYEATISDKIGSNKYAYTEIQKRLVEMKERIGF
jgi:hypothetical protein